MNTIGLECPYCGGDISLKEKDQSIYYCPYCGRKILIDDGIKRQEISIQGSVSYRDEAALKHMELQEEARLRKEEEQRLLALKRKRWWRYVLLWSVVIVVLMIFSLRSFSRNEQSNGVLCLLLYMFGCFVFPSVFPKNEKEKLHPVGTWFARFGLVYVAPLVVFFVVLLVFALILQIANEVFGIQIPFQ